MEYNLNINGQTQHIEVDLQGDNQVSIKIGDAIYQVGYQRISDYKIYLNIDNGTKIISQNAYLAGGPDEKSVIVDGMHFKVQDAEALTQNQSKKKGASNLPDKVTPPMPAVVIAMLVKVGDEVEKGREMVVLSAMKMETTLKAPYNGIVKSINAKPGDKVAPGDILVEIEKNTDENFEQTP